MATLALRGERRSSANPSEAGFQADGGIARMCVLRSGDRKETSGPFAMDLTRRSAPQFSKSKDHRMTREFRLPTRSRTRVGRLRRKGLVRLLRCRGALRAHSHALRPGELIQTLSPADPP